MGVFGVLLAVVTSKVLFFTEDLTMEQPDGGDQIGQENPV
jgi:hypothetical protein